MTREFASLGFSSSRLIENLNSYFENGATSFQSQAIPSILGNNYFDMIVNAPSFTGNTIAILSSLLDKCIQYKAARRYTRSNRPFAIIIAPSNDIVIQLVKKVLKLSQGLNVGTFYAIEDGKRIIDNTFGISRDLMIGTIDVMYKFFFETKIFKVDHLSYLVIHSAHLFDSSHKMVEDFYDKLCGIHYNFFVIFSTEHADHCFKELELNEMLTIECQPELSFEGITHDFFEVTQRRDAQNPKIQYMVSFMNSYMRLHDEQKHVPKTIIFVNDVRTAYFVAICLLKQGYIAFLMTTEQDINKRKAIYERFNSSQLDIIVCTDFDDHEFEFESKLVFNFDLPAEVDDFHRLIQRFKKIKLQNPDGRVFSFFDRHKNANVAFQLKKFFESHNYEVPAYVTKAYKTYHRQFIDQGEKVESHLYSLHEIFYL